MPFYLIKEKKFIGSTVGCTSRAEDPRFEYITSPETGQILEFDTAEEAEQFVVSKFKDQYIHHELKSKYPRLRHNYLFK